MGSGVRWFVAGLLLLLWHPSGRALPETVVVGATDNFPPVNLLDTNGDLTGFGRDLSSAVLAAVDMQPVYRHSGRWSEVEGWLRAGKVDLIHDTAYSAQRDRYFDYSDPILEMPEVIFVRSDQYDIRDFSDTLGRPVACVEGHITDLYLETIPEARCYKVNTPYEGIAALVSGYVDSFIYPEQVILHTAQKLGMHDRIKIVGKPVRTLQWSMVVAEGNGALLERLNQGIARIRASGEYDRVYERWFGKRVLSGYSHRELFVAVAAAVVVSLLVGVVSGLLLYTLRLRRARRALRASENRWRTLVDQAPDIIFTAGRDRRIKFINRPPQGLSAADAVGTNVLDYLQPEYREHVAAILDRVLATGTPESFEIQARGPNDSVSWYSTRVGPLSQNHEIDAALFITRDITEHKRFDLERELGRQQLESALVDSIQAMNMAIQKRDPITADHQVRVAELAIAIAKVMGLDAEQIKGLRLGALIHDVGNLYVPSEILNRPGKLTPSEYELVKVHPEAGYEIMKGVDLPWPVPQMIRQHHERLDGSGYPHGLTGDEIIIEARILAVAEVVEAMCSHRPYRPALGLDAALAEIEANRGTRYDEAVVEACLAIRHEDGFVWSE